MSEISAIGSNLKKVRERVAAAAELRPEELKNICPSPKLVAVGKTQPKEALIEAYKHGARFFGENFVQELVEKATSPELKENCPDIQWHFIGTLQRSNVPKLVSIADRLHLVETVSSEKLAICLNDTLKKKNVESPLNVFIQVNTSGEETKGGVPPGNLVQLVKFVLDKCPNLKFKGLMTIGVYDCTDDLANEDFKLLYNLLDKVCKELDLEQKNLELSMGMSGDFEKAIIMGSTNVRVGTTIFGPRQYSKYHKA
jgi:pyridoxal phosphate enzyme (YggS family)